VLCQMSLEKSHPDCNESPAVVVSIIIIAAQATNYLDEVLSRIPDLVGPANETIVVLDEPIESGSDTARYVSSGAVGPADKRDLGAQAARGRFLAFIDDDAYPDAGWLKAALPHFEDEAVWAVGGPGVTPENDGYRAQVSGWTYSSWIVSGPARHRYIPERARAVDDYPSMNLILRRSAFENVGGFDSSYYPGEDTKLCLEIVKLGGRIMYEPQALVYHHRRPVMLGHLQQIAGYGRHRGYFARAFPETSRRISYFVPSLWLVWLIAGSLVSFWTSGGRVVFLATVAFYCAVVAISAVSVMRPSGSFWIGVGVAPTIIASHLVYGWQFLRGLARSHL